MHRDVHIASVKPVLTIGPAHLDLDRAELALAQHLVELHARFDFVGRELDRIRRHRERDHAIDLAGEALHVEGFSVDSLEPRDFASRSPDGDRGRRQLDRADREALFHRPDDVEMNRDLAGRDSIHVEHDLRGRNLRHIGLTWHVEHFRIEPERNLAGIDPGEVEPELQPARIEQRKQRARARDLKLHEVGTLTHDHDVLRQAAIADRHIERDLRLVLAGVDEQPKSDRQHQRDRAQARIAGHNVGQPITPHRRGLRIGGRSGTPR